MKKFETKKLLKALSHQVMLQIIRKNKLKTKTEKVSPIKPIKQKENRNFKLNENPDNDFRVN